MSIVLQARCIRSPVSSAVDRQPELHDVNVSATQDDADAITDVPILAGKDRSQGYGRARFDDQLHSLPEKFEGYDDILFADYCHVGDVMTHNIQVSLAES